MLLLYDALKVCAMLKKTQALQYLKDVIVDIVEGERHHQIHAMKEKRIESLKFGIHAIYEQYETKPLQQAFYESHRFYVDFQMVLKGEELFYVGDQDDFKVARSYDEEKDLIVYETLQNDHQNIPLITLKPRSLAVFLPYDVHAGGLHTEQSDHIVKCVLKVPRDLLKFSF